MHGEKEKNVKYNTRSEQLGNVKIPNLLLNLSLPASIGMIVNALYNIVDTIFIGRGVDALAIGGLAIAFPIQMMVMALAQMIGIGAASAISRSLGAGDEERADFVAGNSFTSVAVLSGIFVIIGLVFTDPILRIFGATDTLLPYARDYITIIFIGSLFFSFAVNSNNLIRAEGNAKVAMFSMIIGTGLNIILDPIFIFDQLNFILFKIPGFNLGIKGAALATIFSQFISFLYILRYLYSGKSSLKVKLHHLKPNINIIREMLAVGSASFVRQVAGSLMAIVLNNSLRIYGGDLGDISITILGIVNRVLMFLFMPLFGIIQGMQPIAGYNYGANKLGRVREVVKLSIITTTTLATFGWIFAEIFPSVIVRLFTTDEAIIQQGTGVLRIIVFMVPIIGVQIVGSSLFQALGKAIPSLILSMTRQILFLIPLVLIIPKVFQVGLFGIWIAFPISDFMSTLVTSVLLINEMKKMKDILA